MSRPPKEIPLKTKIMEEKPEEDELDIAPEDMSEQIDDLLERELYSDETEPAVLLDDDTEVNTMDMSVEELLSQLSEKKGAVREEAVPETSAISPQAEEPEEEENAEEPEELSIDDLLSQLDSAAPVHPEEPSPIIEEEPEQTSYTSKADLGLEALLDSIAAKNNVEPAQMEPQAEPAVELAELEEDEPEEEELVEETEAVAEDIEEPQDSMEEA